MNKKPVPTAVIEDPRAERLAALPEAVRANLGAARCQRLNQLSNGRLEEHLQNVCNEIAGRCSALEDDAGVAALYLTQRCGKRVMPPKADTAVTTQIETVSTEAAS